MSVEHTPGSWVVAWAKTHTKAEPYDIHSASGERVLRWGSFIKPGSERASANARLIAAAPDLLEALEYLLKYHRSGGHEGNHDTALLLAIAATTRARGDA